MSAMVWVKIDDHADQHPKVAAVGPHGFALFVAGLCYSNRTLTDGFLPKSVARTLLDVPRVNVVVALLVKEGLWEQVDGGYQIHDFSEFQPSKADVLAEREATRLRVERYRALRKAQGNDDGNGVTDDVTNGVSDGVGTPPSRDPGPGGEKTETGAKAPLSEKQPTPKEQKVYEHWRAAFGKPRTKLTEKRLKAIRKALKHHTPGELCLAIDGIPYETPQWWIEHNEPWVIFRDQERVEHLLDLEERRPSGPPSNGVRAGMTPAEIVAYTKGRP